MWTIKDQVRKTKGGESYVKVRVVSRFPQEGEDGEVKFIKMRKSIVKAIIAHASGVEHMITLCDGIFRYKFSASDKGVTYAPPHFYAWLRQWRKEVAEQLINEFQPYVREPRTETLVLT